MKAILVKLGKLFSVRMLAIGLTFLQTIAITQVFGSEVFGLLSFALSISALAVLILSAGLDQVLMRDIARIGKKHVVHTERWKNTWKLVRRLVVPGTLLVSLVGALLVIFTELTGQYQYTVLVAFFLLPVVLARKYLEAMCQGTKQIIRSIVGSQLVYPFLMILGAAYVWYFGIEANSLSVSFTYVMAICGSLIASLLLIYPALKRMTEVNENNRNKAYEDGINESLEEKALLKSGMHFSLVSLGFVLGQHVDVLLMGIISTPENVALVRIAARIAEMVGLIRAILLLQYKPFLAEAHGKSDINSLQNHVFLMAKLFAITGIPIAVIFLIFAKEAMLVFGPEFVAGDWTMRVYVAGVLITLLLGPANAVLAMSGNEGTASQILIKSLIIQIVLDIALIPYFGALGCAISNFIAMSYKCIASRAKVKGLVGVETSIFGYLLQSRR